MSAGVTGAQMREVEHNRNRYEQDALDLAHWKESEHVLSILRKIQPDIRSDGEAAFLKWKGTLNDRHCTT